MCEYCNKREDSECEPLRENPKVHIEPRQRDSGYVLSFQTIPKPKVGEICGFFVEINFCPMCGEPLSEPHQLKLDELRERERKPVYVMNTEYPHWNGWYICGGVDWEQGYGAEDFVRIEGVQKIYASELGNEWVVFDREPKAVSK